MRSDYDKTLSKLSALLRRTPMTAREIADKLECCIPAVYQRIEALRRGGEQVYSATAESSTATGPRPRLYSIR